MELLPGKTERPNRFGLPARLGNEIAVPSEDFSMLAVRERITVPHRI